MKMTAGGPRQVIKYKELTKEELAKEAELKIES
jgi:hypothetical protein